LSIHSENLFAETQRTKAVVELELKMNQTASSHRTTWI